MSKRKGAALTLICLICLPVLLIYAFPWGTQSVDWSIMPEDGEQWQGERGWTVYALRLGQRVLLSPDGNGGYSGCAPGETIYFSREWDTDIASPVLRIQAVSAGVAVWIDEELEYTDQPLMDTSIGSQTLPMLTADRFDPLEIPLYGDLQGRKLTIAQATPLISEKPGYFQVYPCAVEVISDFGYERGIISQAYRLGLTCAVLCIAWLLTCAVSIWYRDLKLIPLALIALARLLATIAGAEFFQRYTGIVTANIASLADQLSFSLTLGFLAAECHKGRGALAAMSVAHALTVMASAAAQAVDWQSDMFFYVTHLPDWMATVFMAAALAIALWQQQRKNAFFQVFLKALAASLAVWVLAEIAWMLYNPSIIEYFLSGQMLYAVFFREPIIWLTQTAGLAAVLVLAARQAAAQRERRVFDAVFAKAAQQSYESLKRHQDEVMMLRHETVRHYAALKGFVECGENARATDYIDDLLSRQEAIPQVIKSDNQLVNIILNSRVSWAESAGVKVEIRHMSVPKELPIPDTQLVSLLLNIVDNAIEAASRAEGQIKTIRLDMHCKNDHFVFCCENSMTQEAEKAPADGLNYRGYGRRIIERIMAPYGNLVTVVNHGGWYAVSVALPLHRAG